MNQQEFLRAFEQVLEMPDGSLEETSKLDDLESWDSVAMVTLMSMVEEKCGVQLSPRRIASCATVEDVYQLTRPA
jgi:acyl carrier protein